MHFQVLQGFSVFSDEEIVEVDDRDPLRSRKVAERYVAKGRAFWAQKETPVDSTNDTILCENGELAGPMETPTENPQETEESPDVDE